MQLKIGYEKRWTSSLPFSFFALPFLVESLSFESVSSMLNRTEYVKQDLSLIEI